MIKKANELVLPSVVKMLVYGQAGAGKTTLALSAPRPLLLDFDGGIGRVNISHMTDTVQVSTWQDALDVLKEDLSDYETIVVDTVSKMIEAITNHICGSRQPRLQDWGKINGEFQSFTRSIAALGKHVVYVAQRDSVTSDDGNTIYTPSMRAKNLSAIVADIDLLGYLETRVINGQRQRTITFDPTERNEGKNTCNLPGVMVIPDIINPNGDVTAPNDFICRQVITPYKAMLERKQAQVAEFTAKMDDLKKVIAAIKDAKTAAAAAKAIKEFEHTPASMAQARKLFCEALAKAGLKYDKESDTYKVVKE